MTAGRIDDELNRRPVVLERVIELVRLGHRDPGIAGGRKNQGRGLDLMGVGHRRLAPVVHGVVVEPGRAAEPEPGPGVHVGQVVPVEPVGHGRPRHRGLPALIMGREPRGHVAAVRPTRHRDPGFVDDAAGLERGHSRHHVAAGTVAGVVDDRALEFVTHVVAAAVIRIEDDPSLRGKDLILGGPPLG